MPITGQALACAILITAILKDCLSSYFTYETTEAQRVKGTSSKRWSRFSTQGCLLWSQSCFLLGKKVK